MVQRDMAEALEAEAERLKQQLEASTEQINSLEEELQVALNTSEARAAESEALGKALNAPKHNLFQPSYASVPSVHFTSSELGHNSRPLQYSTLQL